MIARMRKLHLVALSYERDAVLDALERTNAVEVAIHPEQEGTSPLSLDCGELKERLSRAENALSLLTARAEEYAKQHGVKDFSLPKEQTVSYSEFLSAWDKREETEALIGKVETLCAETEACAAEETRLVRAAEGLSPYLNLKKPFSAFTDTQHTKTFLGLLSSAGRSVLDVLCARPLCALETEPAAEDTLLLLSVHRSEEKEAETALSSAGFLPCPYSGDRTALQMAEEVNGKRAENEVRRAEAEKTLFSLASEVGGLRLYCDRLSFELEKAEAANKMRTTERTFFLEAFVPADSEEAVKEALKTDFPVYYEFTDPEEGEFVPTLAKNNKVVENFEVITNMYSPPNAWEIDPNTVMSFFYSLFIGFIMADIGYGLMMLLGGGFLYYKNRASKGGIKSLAGVFAIGGIFAIVWGVLFNSLLGIRILPFTVMPDAQTKMWSLAGIEIPAVLLISLLIGIVQLMAGYLCKMAQGFHRGQYLDGICDGGLWALFSVGVGVAFVGLITIAGDGGETVFHAPVLVKAGGIVAGVSLLAAVLTAGRHEKFLGKFSKGFGSLYGLLNYFTDVLSYIRLYGLMLTGAVIAQVVSQYALQFLSSGSVLIVVGAVLLVVGHVFNLAISLLGAYIHTARLQYVEFFGKFYIGEGELFTPLGSNRKYVKVA